MYNDADRMRFIVAIVPFALLVTLPMVQAQTEEGAEEHQYKHPPDTVAGQVERGYAHDPSRDKPYVRTEADDNPDVAKRPGLRHALARKRMGGVDSPFDQDDFLDSEDISKTFKDAIRERWEKVIAPALLPPTGDTIEWRGRDRNPGAAEQNIIAARWTTPVGTLVASGQPDSKGVRICLQLSDEDRISFRFLTQDEGAAHATRPQDVNPQNILDKPRLFEILTTYFRLPLDKMEATRVWTGPSGVYDGVRIFSGGVDWSRRHLQDRPDLAAIGRDSSEYNEAKLFITDSEPQYFCIGVSLGE